MSANNLPNISPEATKKAVLENSLLNPLTLYPTGVGLLGGLAIGLFGLNPVTALAAAGGIGIVSLLLESITSFATEP